MVKKLSIVLHKLWRKAFNPIVCPLSQRFGAPRRPGMMAACGGIRPLRRIHEDLRSTPPTPRQSCPTSGVRPWSSWARWTPTRRPQAGGDAVVAALPAGMDTVAMGDGAGHYPHARSPDAVAELVIPFLKAHTGALDPWPGSVRLRLRVKAPVW